MGYGANIYYPIDVEIVEAKGCRVWDKDGNMYIDCLAGYSALSHGHRHPEILRAAIEQMGKVTLTSRAFKNDTLAQWEEHMCKTFMAKMVLPMNSGAEAVETGIKIARKWGHIVKGIPDGSQEIIVCDGNFHGRTITVISFSPNDSFRKGFGPLTPGFKMIPFNDAKALAEAITPNTVAFLVEPVQGEGGMNIPSYSYFQDVRKICTDNNVLLILDEVQTGLGRTGMMLAEGNFDITADLTLLGKALGGGVVPISAVLDRKGSIMDVLGHGDHGSTWGGNPLACAVSLAAIHALYKDGLVNNTRKMGHYLLTELVDMGLNARGLGLMIGIEVEQDTSRKWCEELAKRYVLVKDTKGKVIRVTPPLCITRVQIDYVLYQIEIVKKLMEK